jgi:hypothetical protein
MDRWMRGSRAGRGARTQPPGGLNLSSALVALRRACWGLGSKLPEKILTPSRAPEIVRIDGDLVPCRIYLAPMGRRSAASSTGVVRASVASPVIPASWGHQVGEGGQSIMRRLRAAPVHPRSVAGCDVRSFLRRCAAAAPLIGRPLSALCAPHALVPTAVKTRVVVSRTQSYHRSPCSSSTTAVPP